MDILGSWVVHTVSYDFDSDINSSALNWGDDIFWDNFTRLFPRITTGPEQQILIAIVFPTAPTWKAQIRTPLSYGRMTVLSYDDLCHEFVTIYWKCEISYRFLHQTTVLNQYH